MQFWHSNFPGIYYIDIQGKNFRQLFLYQPLTGSHLSLTKVIWNMAPREICGKSWREEWRSIYLREIQILIEIVLWLLVLNIHVISYDSCNFVQKILSRN